MRWLGKKRCVKVAGAGAAAVALLCLAVWFCLPFPATELAQYPAAVMLRDRDGGPLRLILGAGGMDCRPGYRPAAGDWIDKAVVAAEDRRFWHHPGLDPLAILRAAWQDVRHLRRVSGASTITTQVVRLLEPRPRTLFTKVVEAFRALQLERKLSKTEILAQYLDRAPFGGNIQGIEAASRRYFGKCASDLSLAEAALLAGLPQSPSRFRPDRHLDRARLRQAWVLERMQVCGMITPEQAAAAKMQPVQVRLTAYPFRAPHFAEFAWRRQGGRSGGAGPVVAERTPGSVLRAPRSELPPAGELRTSLAPELQAAAEAVLRRHAPARREQGIDGGAVVILEVKTGHVLALVGSPDYYDLRRHGRVNGAVAVRSAGSTLKPFLYAMAFDRGQLTPGLVLPDVPMVFKNYAPANFDDSFNGLVTVREALVESLNMPAIALTEEVGLTAFYQRLQALGLKTLRRAPAQYGAGLAIGNCEVRLLDLVNAYACLARGGDWLPLSVVADTPEAVPVPLFSPEAAWVVSDMLSGAERAVSATGHRADTRLPRVAWKTGTSSGLRDAWAVAWNPELVVGVWYGNPDGRPAPGLVGAEIATPVVWELFAELYRGRDAPWFSRPPTVRTREVCAVSGQPPGPHCGPRVADVYVPGVTAVAPCRVHRLCLAGSGADGAARCEVREVWSAAVAAFLRRAPGADGASAPETTGVGVAQTPKGTGDAPRIVSPAAGSVYRKLAETAAGAQRLPLLAETGGSNRRLFWFVDDCPLGSANAAEPLYWPLARGRHTLVCSDSAGRSARVSIAVE